MLDGLAGVAQEIDQDPVQLIRIGDHLVGRGDLGRELHAGIGKPRLGVCGEGMHSHPDHVTVVMNDARVKVTLPDGKTIVASNKAGDVLFEPAGSHAVENIGGRDVKSLLIEIKGAAKA